MRSTIMNGSSRCTASCFLVILAISTRGDDPKKADYLDFKGYTAPRAQVDLQTQVGGILEKILFKDGQMVTKGQVLFELDARLPKAQMDQAKAHYGAVRAQCDVRAADTARYRALAKQGGASREEVDKALGLEKEAQFVLEGAKAALELAELNLMQTRIAAPIEGRIGKTLVSEGTALSPVAGKTLATIISLDPIYVYFEVDEKYLPRLKRLTDKNVPLATQILLTGGEETPLEGAVDFIDNQVDRTSGKILFRAMIRNEKGAYLPGMSARVRVLLPSN